ncbi:MAG: phosphoribosylformylglycinamidine synthase subunit PurL, partial [Chlorobiaceae bacterium]|nr:phosphoribosylformylglycinamidine synthase subunit PurL [Chlorobiaceae bacterium]
DIDNLVLSTFREAGDAIVLLGDPELSLDGSEYLLMQYGTPGTDSPAVDLEHEKNLQELLVTLAAKQLVRSAHDVSDGGLAVTLFEQSIMDRERMLGFEVDLEASSQDSTALQKLLFSEAQGRVVISIDPARAGAVIEEADRLKVPVRIIGKVVAEGASIAVNGRPVAEYSLGELVQAYEHALESSLHLEEL